MSELAEREAYEARSLVPRRVTQWHWLRPRCIRRTAEGRRARPTRGGSR